MSRGEHTGNGKDWPLERIEELQTLAAEGLSARDMADKMHMSRNAILGMCYRRKIPIIKQAKGPKRRRIRAGMGNVRITLNTRPKQTPSRGLGMAIREAAVHLPPGMTDLPATAPEGLGVTFFDLAPEHCRYVCSGEGLGIVYCGATSEPDCSWCARHRRVVYRPRG
jgi:hypothetical protein